MRMTMATLCDAASVREGLLHLLGAGITMIQRGSYPAPLGVQLALLFVMNPKADLRPYQLKIAIHDMEKDEEIGGIEASISPAGPTSYGDAYPVSMPLVLDLRDAGVPRPGSYEIQVELEGERLADLPVAALKVPTPAERA